MNGRCLECEVEPPIISKHVSVSVPVCNRCKPDLISDYMALLVVRDCLCVCICTCTVIKEVFLTCASFIFPVI